MKFTLKKTQGAVIRCQAKWAEFAEKPTKYFLNLEKSRFNKKTILRMSDKEGKIITNEKQILEEINCFYQKLYSKPNQNEWDMNKYMEKLDYPKIEQKMKEELEKPIDEKELGEALMLLKNSKSPGVDGLPADFYKVFWIKLKRFFHELVLEIIAEGKFHLSARRGIICLLEKLNKNLLNLENYRPITLLCADFKIVDKVIAM